MLKRLKSLMLSSLSLPLMLTAPSLAGSEHPEISEKHYRSHASMGCMILRECTDRVKRIYSLSDVERDLKMFGSTDMLRYEIDSILSHLTAVGIEVYLAPDKYFVPSTRGIYHTVENKMFLNRRYITRVGSLAAVIRHEGYHAAQDCMAGGIQNEFIAIIEPEENVPQIWVNQVNRTYTGHYAGSRPWEREATWAGHTEWMTENALNACRGEVPMWKTITPTPMTREWLEDNGYLP